MAEEIDNLIEITDDDGTVIKCELHDIIEFENKQYALLVEVDEDEEEYGEVVLMRYLEEGDESYFETIDDDEEFEKVSNYIESLDPEYDDEAEE